MTAILNSKPATLFYRLLHDIKGKVFAKISLDNLSNFPIPDCKGDLKANLVSGSIITAININNLYIQSQKFQRTIQRKFNLTELPKKLQDWYLLSYSEFIKELGKKKVVLSLVEEAEWEDYFLQESKKALDLKSQIDQTDKEIDQMVYALYGLTEEEIRIMEGS